MASAISEDRFVDPATWGGSRLFIVDARNRVESRRLLRWIDETSGKSARGDAICITLSDNIQSNELEKLAHWIARPGMDDCLLIPLRVAWRIPGFDIDRPLRFRDVIVGDPRHPGAIRGAIALAMDRQRATCLTGRSATIADLKKRFDAQVSADEDQRQLAFAAFVARQAGLALDIMERRMQGARYKVPRFVTDSLVASPQFRAEIDAAISAHDLKPDEAQSDMRQALKELVSKPTALFIDMRARLDQFVMGLGYDRNFRTDPDELARLRDTIHNHPTLLLFTHKTYLDGSTPNALLYTNDLPAMHSFGGINLDFAGLGPLMRRSGIIFIRRTFKDNPVYKVVLRQYIAWLLARHFPMGWAIEGTRSRLGKLMPPQFGLLKYVIDAAHKGNIANLHIVPVVTSFDLIRDVEEYATEQAGRVKKPESLGWFISYLKSLREPMGHIRIDLGNPIVLPTSPDPETQSALARIAFDTSVEANRVTPITITALICMILLGNAPRGATEGEIEHSIRPTIGWAKARDIRVSEELEAFDWEKLRIAADRMVNSGLVFRSEQGSENVYAVEPAKHPLASYYRNTIVHHFIDKAFIELALIRVAEMNTRDAETAFRAEALRLRDLFKFEFFYPPRARFLENLEAELHRTTPDWRQGLSRGEAGIKRLIDALQPLVGHAALLPFAEAYIVVFEQFARLANGESLSMAECTRRALVEARQAYLLRRISSQASISKVLFENGYRLAGNLKLDGESDDTSRQERERYLAGLRALVRRMERLRIDALSHVELQMKGVFV